MKTKKLFKTHLLSLAAVCGLATALASCSSEELAKNDVNTDAENHKGETVFMAGASQSRTSIDYATGNYFWEEGDRIYVKDDNGNWQCSNAVPAAQAHSASVKFYVPGKFGGNSSYKIYYGGKYGYQNQVNISSSQRQTAPNDTKLLGEAGDCAIGDAHLITSKNQYEFTLTHQAAILVFQPFTSNLILSDCYLTKVEVNSDDNIMGTYTFNPATGELTGSGSGKQITLETRGNWGSTYQDGFPMTNNTASLTTNGAYMLIARGTHKLTVRYWLKDTKSGTEGAVTKRLPSFTYDKNTFYDMTADLKIKNYTTPYYEWDAMKPYWYGHEWDKPGYVPGVDQSMLWSETNSGYAQNASDPRYYNGSFPGPGIRNDASHNPLFNTVPNVNEMVWYCLKGDIRWEGDELWSTFKHLYKGGIWLKKKAAIIAYEKSHGNPSFSAADMEAHAPNGTDIRTTTANFSVVPPKLSDNPIPASELSDYFYLPALGDYAGGRFWGPGGYGYYWSSSANPTNNFGAYGLRFLSSRVYVDNSDDGRDRGYSVLPFE